MGIPASSLCVSTLNLVCNLRTLTSTLYLLLHGHYSYLATTFRHICASSCPVCGADKWKRWSEVQVCWVHGFICSRLGLLHSYCRFSICLYSTSNYYVEFLYIFQQIVYQLQKIAKSKSRDIQLEHIVPLTWWQGWGVHGLCTGTVVLNLPNHCEQRACSLHSLVAKSRFRH